MTAPCSPDSTSAAAPISSARSRALTTASDADDDGALESVRAILADVRDRGDDAVRDLTERFDGCRLDELRVPAADLRAALDAAAPEFRAALEVAADRIREYHATQLTAPEPALERDGVTLRELTVPVGRAGLYVPGGRAAYPSTVLMTAIPAQLAGVERARAVRPARGRRHACPHPRSRRRRSSVSPRCTASAAPRPSPRSRTAPRRSARST